MREKDSLVGRINSILPSPGRLFCGLTMASLLTLASCATYTYQLTPEALKGMLRKAARQSQVMSFGEHHKRMLDDFFVISLLPMLKEEGYTHLAYEIPTQFQGIIDNYLSGEITYRELKGRMIQDNEIPLLKAAKHYGFKVVAYDTKLDSKKQVEIIKDINNTRILTPENAEEIVKLLVFHDYVISDKRESECIENLKNRTTRFNLMGQRRDVKMLGARLNEVVNSRNFSVSMAEIEDVITDCGDWYSVDLHITPYKQLHFLRKFNHVLYRELWRYRARKKIYLTGQPPRK